MSTAENHRKRSHRSQSRHFQARQKHYLSSTRHQDGYNFADIFGVFKKVRKNGRESRKANAGSD